MRRTFALAFAFFAGAASLFAQEVSAGPPLERIAFGSCNREYKPQLLWKPILECKPDLWIWLGDIVYGRSDDLKDLARRYGIVKEQPEYKLLRERARVIGVWDDNDFGISNGGKDNPNKIESQRLLLDFLDEPAESARRRQAGIFASYTFGPAGKQVKIILLDGRFNRERPGAATDILGAPQWEWLEQQLTGSTADVHLIVSSTQVIPTEQPYEKWAQFPKSRQRLFELLEKTQPRNVIFLSGDRHLGEISKLIDPHLASPVYDITSSGMTHHAENNFFHNFSGEPNQYRRGQNYLGLNFGIVEFNWEASPPTATLQVRGVDNVLHIEEKVALSPAATETR